MHILGHALRGDLSSVLENQGAAGLLFGTVRAAPRAVNLRGAHPMKSPSSSASVSWPELSYEAWKDTGATLHMWTQIVGKLRMARTPWENHSWHVTLRLSVRGLVTPPI